jgi:hypothetical protein
MLGAAGEARVADALQRLASLLGAYSEWGQPRHGVGDDVRVLGLPARRPHTERVLRMVCRHNRYVQEFGRIKDGDEIARREALWRAVIEEIEFEAGRPAAALPPAVFRRLLEARAELPAFRARVPAPDSEAAA